MRRRCSTPTGSATRATRPTRWPRRCRRCRRAASTGRMMRANMRLGGLLSDGIALGHRTGFDSGSTLDYVYRNEPRGAGPLGRLIDRNYLELDRLARHPPAQAACRGTAARRAMRAAAPTRACRCGSSISPPATAATCSTRWRRSGITPDSILLRDYSDLNVDAGTRADRASAGLPAIARFVKGDAFDRDSLAAIEPPPTLAIVSGLYELFPDNAMVRAFARRAGRRGPAGRLSGLHRPALASAARTDRARLDQPSRRPGLDHAPPHAGRDGPARRGRRLRASSSSASTNGASSPCRSPSGSEARLEPRSGRCLDRSRSGGAAVAPRRRLALPARPLLLRQLRRGQLAGGAARRMSARSSSPGSGDPVPRLDDRALLVDQRRSTALSLFVCASKAELDTHARGC